MRAIRPLVAAALATAGLAGALAVPAQAHVRLQATSPKAGAVRASAPADVLVSFSGSFVTGKLTVTGPGAKVVGRGGQDPRRPSRLLAELRRGLKAGRYTASWRILDDDGHRQSGRFTFRVR